MIINGRVWNPGEMRTSVVLKSRTITQGAGGFKKKEYTTTIATVWAKWVNVHGREAWDAQAAGAESAATVTIRYRSDINTTCAVEKDGVVYEIVSVDDIQERHELLELKVKRWSPG
jgi:SPP1 family predicted phage head-tail adaptor